MSNKNLINGEYDWAKSFGSSGSDIGADITISNDGSIFISGWTTGNLNNQIHAGVANNSDGINDSYIMKLDSDGKEQWTKLFGTTEEDQGYAVHISSDGFIYITGETSGNLNNQIHSGVSNDEINNSGKADIFVIKLNSDGTEIWTKIYGSKRDDLAWWSEIDENNNLYLFGETHGNLNGEINNSEGLEDGFVMKVDSDGNQLWTSLVGTRFNEEFFDIAISNDGFLYVVGETSDDGRKSPNGISNSDDILITKLDTDGKIIWTKSFGKDSSDEVGYSIEIDSNGSLYVGGRTNGNLNDAQNNGDYDAFLMKLDSEGNEIWTKLYGSDSYESGGLKIREDGYIYYAGTTNGNLNGIQNNGDADAFLMKLDSEGNEIWTKLFGSENEEGFGHFEFFNDSIYLTGFSVGGEFETNTARGDDEIIIFRIDDPIENQILIAYVNENYIQDSSGFSSIIGSAPVTVSAYEVGIETTLDSIKDYDGNLHAGDVLEDTASSYKYQGLLDVNGDGVFEAIFTNKVSKRWVTLKVDSVSGKVNFGDYGAGGGTRVVGIYEDPLIAEGASNGGFLSDGFTPAPANFGVSDEERYKEVNGDIIDRLALNSQVRFQNDLDIDNLSVKHAGDYDSDGVSEVYWKTNDGTAYLRALMHADGNIRYANYQSESQMNEYLSALGHSEIISEIV